MGQLRVRSKKRAAGSARKSDWPDRTDLARAKANGRCQTGSRESLRVKIFSFDIYQDALGDLLTDDSAEFSKVGRANLSNVKEAVAAQRGETIEEYATREIASQERRHATHQLEIKEETRQYRIGRVNHHTFHHGNDQSTS